MKMKYKTDAFQFVSCLIFERPLNDKNDLFQEV